jgi:hypothetical protein
MSNTANCSGLDKTKSKLETPRLFVDDFDEAAIPLSVVHQVTIVPHQQDGTASIKPEEPQPSSRAMTSVAAQPVAMFAPPLPPTMVAATEGQLTLQSDDDHVGDFTPPPPLLFGDEPDAMEMHMTLPHTLILPEPDAGGVSSDESDWDGLV